MNRRRRAALIVGILMAAGIAAAAVALRRPSEGATQGDSPYVPGERTAGIDDSLARKASDSAPVVTFEDVAADVGIEFVHFHGDRSVQLPEDMGSGAAWGDYDGDGDDDLYLVAISGSLPQRANYGSSPVFGRLFRNDGGRFSDVTEATGTAFHGLGMGASWADFDGDGDVDLLVTGLDKLALHANPGPDAGGAWPDVADKAGLAQPGFHSGAAWADYDRDGDLDLYLGRYVLYLDDLGDTVDAQAEVPATLNPSSYDPAANALYRNDGKGGFTDVAEELGVANAAGRTLQVIWSDLDDDGLPDLYVANDVSDNALYHNEGDGRLKDISHQALVADYRGAMGLAVADVEGDGPLDLFVTHWIAQENALYAGMPRDPGKPLRFMDVADMMGLGQVGLDYIGWGTAFLDYDLDGRIDLAVTNGSTFQVKGSSPPTLIPMRPLLFWNKGPTEGFFDAGSTAGPFWTTPSGGRGLAVADFDRDGDPDLVSVSHAGGAHLLRNDGVSGGGQPHWTAVRLEGSAPNRQGIGAKVTLRVPGRPNQVREVHAGSSYMSQHSLEQLFGLGDHAGPISIGLRWPDGVVERHEGLPVDRRIRLVRGAAPEVTGDRRAFFDALRPAQAASAAGRWKEAVAAVRKALRLDPGHATSLHVLAGAQAELGRYARAAAAWTTLLAGDSDSPRAHSGLAALHACPAEGAPWSLDLARKHLQAVIAINPEQTGPFTRLAEVELAAKAEARAKELLEGVVAANHMDPAAHHLLAYLRWKAGDADSAVSLLTTAAKAASGPIKAKGATSEEGDTTARVLAKFPDCRPFAAARRGLAKRYASKAPTVASLEHEFAKMSPGR